MKLFIYSEITMNSETSQLVSSRRVDKINFSQISKKGFQTTINNYWIWMKKNLKNIKLYIHCKYKTK